MSVTSFAEDVNKSTSKRFVLPRQPQSDKELWYFVYATWGVKIPVRAVCPGHCSPFRAFADAYFARNNVAVWKASRGFGGKTFLLSLLGMTEMASLSARIAVLGGSGAQSARVHDSMQSFWEYPGAPKHLLARDPTMYKTFLTNGAKADTLTASQRSVRGLHPQRLRMDEIDEMELGILTSAQGQTMRTRLNPSVDTQTVMSSTHQYPDGCVDGSTLVLTGRGEIHVQDVTKEDVVMTREGWQPVQAVVFSGFKAVVDVQLSNGRVLRCTDDHRVATPGGWNIPRWMSPGDEVCSVGTNDIRREPSRSVGNLTDTSASSTRLLPRSESVAGLALSAAPIVESGIAFGERMTVTANGLHCIDSRGSDATKHVGLLSHGFQMPNVDAGSGTAKMIDLSTFWDRTDEHHVGEAMSATSPDLCADLSVPVSLCSIPNPTLSPEVAVSDGDSLREPLTVVSITHAIRVLQPVYDLQVENCHEFLAEGVIVHNTMTWALKTAAERGWGVYHWCFKESMAPGGWLKEDEVLRKKSEITQHMWETEYELQEPSFDGRAFTTQYVKEMYDTALGHVPGTEGDYYEFVPPERGHTYVTACDWARDKDWTIIDTWDTTNPLEWRRVAWQRAGRQPWPIMVRKANLRIGRYGGKFIHDATGVGKVVSDYLELPPTRDSHSWYMDQNITRPFNNAMYNDLIAAVEGNRMKSPMIDYAYTEMLFATNEMLFGKDHPPDSVCANGLAWSMRDHSAGVAAAPSMEGLNRANPWRPT